MQGERANSTGHVDDVTYLGVPLSGMSCTTPSGCNYCLKGRASNFAFSKAVRVLRKSVGQSGECDATEDADFSSG
jgi:hypothetical protein